MNRRMKQDRPWAQTMVVPALLATALTVWCGVMHGRLTNRWGPPAELKAAGHKLRGVPRLVGSWRASGDKPLDDASLAMLQCTGYIHRTYVDGRTGATVNVVVLVGPPGPMTVHTPEICYSSRLFSEREPRRRVKLQDATAADAELWYLQLRTPDVNADPLEVYYGWSNGQAWVAPEQPRFQLASLPFVYKIQLAGLADVTPAADAASPCRRFLADFLPALRPHLQQVAGSTR